MKVALRVARWNGVARHGEMRVEHDCGSRIQFVYNRVLIDLEWYRLLAKSNVGV